MANQGRRVSIFTHSWFFLCASSPSLAAAAQITNWHHRNVQWWKWTKYFQKTCTPIYGQSRAAARDFSNPDGRDLHSQLLCFLFFSFWPYVISPLALLLLGNDLALLFGTEEEKKEEEEKEMIIIRTKVWEKTAVFHCLFHLSLFPDISAKNFKFKYIFFNPIQGLRRMREIESQIWAN